MSVGAYAAASDTGRKRRRNEDSYVIAPPLFAVADGMGGAQAGEIASGLAAAALEDADPGTLSGEERVMSLIQEANRRVYERSNEDPSASGMGTTITVALVEDAGVTIGHVGDSRAYRYRKGSIEQITDDHSLVNELIKSGKLSPEEAETHPQRSVITRALGTDPDVDVDSFTLETETGDVFLLCSDGLTTMVDDDEILDVLERHHDDLDRATKALVSAANRGGGRTTSPWWRSRSLSGTWRFGRGRRRGFDGECGSAASGRHVGDPGRPGQLVASARAARGGAHAAIRSSRGPRPAHPRDAASPCVAAVLLVWGSSADSQPVEQESRAAVPDHRGPAHSCGLRERLHADSRGSPAARSGMRCSSSRFSRRASRGALRRSARRPVRLPIAALLAAVGVTEIYRLGPNDAFRQSTGRD
jgi:serine/threonine protein phosphatase PrpC